MLGFPRFYLMEKVQGSLALHFTTYNTPPQYIALNTVNAIATPTKTNNGT